MTNPAWLGEDSACAATDSVKAEPGLVQPPVAGPKSPWPPLPLDLNIGRWASVNSTRGVRRLLADGAGIPRPLPAREVDALLAAVSAQLTALHPDDPGIAGGRPLERPLLDDEAIAALYAGAAMRTSPRRDWGSSA